MLSIGVEYSTTIRGLMDGHDLTCTLTREELKEICMPHLDKWIKPTIKDLMKGAKAPISAVEEVVVTGGMS